MVSQLTRARVCICSVARTQKNLIEKLSVHSRADLCKKASRAMWMMIIVVVGKYTHVVVVVVVAVLCWWWWCK